MFCSNRGNWFVTGIAVSNVGATVSLDALIRALSGTGAAFPQRGGCGRTAAPHLQRNNDNCTVKGGSHKLFTE